MLVRVLVQILCHLRRGLFCLLLFVPVALSANVPSGSLSQLLGWVTEPNNGKNICNGYYRELPILYQPSSRVTTQANNYDFSADHVTYSFKGVSTAVGHVKVTQTNSQLTAQRAQLYRNKKTNKPSHIKLTGNVRMREPGKLVLAKQADFDIATGTKTLHDLIYRFTLGDENVLTAAETSRQAVKKPAKDYSLNARGKAAVMKQYTRTYAVLRDASYTTCPPTSHVWTVKASTIKLNKQTGRGEALNSRLLLGPIPVFYMPYFNFPIDKRRQTGFLWPEFGYDSSDGANVAAPFYWNLAPNYDATITPKMIQNRGLLINGLVRYLTPFNTGHFSAGYINNDREFHHFQYHAPTNYQNNPALNRTIHADDNRRAFSWEDHGVWNKHLTSDIQYNYVSDDYYMQDFDTDVLDVSDDQLPRQAQLNYYDTNWNFLANWQAYQTLHRVNGGAADQYSRLPQLQWNADYPDQWLGLDYGVTSEFDRFVKTNSLSVNANGTEVTRALQGDRVAAKPKISLPLSWIFAYITPEIKLDAVKYKAQHTPAGNSRDPGMAVPIFDVKSGLYFDRDATIFHHDYRQTLEPVIYYLYVPYRNQKRLPLFDTAANTFSYTSLFQDDRFSGWDRVGDANQIAYALTSRFIDADTGSELANASIGQIRYFRDRKVQLSPGRLSSTDREILSPVAASATYNMTQNWSANAGTAWDEHRKRFDNGNAGVTYQRDPTRIVHMTYGYARGGDTLPGTVKDSAKNDLKQTTISTMWRLTDHWSVMGGFNYNWSHQHTQGYFYGLSYNACCWAVRFIGGQTFTGPSPLNQYRSFDDYTFEHKNVFYIQFALKGLGNFGGTSAQSYLESNIDRYADRFGEVETSNV